MGTKSKKLFSKAKQLIPGGVNSPVRAFKSVNLDPPYISHGKGSKIYDVDGNEYIDYVCSWGPLILGHANDKVLKAVIESIHNGISFGANTEIEVKFAELLTGIYPSIQKVRMVNSGTEATMSALRLARGYTRKRKVIKFNGCYHGHNDSFLVKAGSGVTTLSIPGSPGIPQGVTNDTLIAKYNDIESVKQIISNNKDQIAAVILEPIMANAGLILPKNNFLQKLREITSNENIVLIFDEVITGFRVALGGAQQLYDIVPDLTCLGKIIGGGFPIGAYGGKVEIMNCLAPAGPVYQAGTLSGNPVGLAAGYGTILELQENNAYKILEEKSAMLEEGLKNNLKTLGLNYVLHRIGSLLCLFFTNQLITNFQSALNSNTEFFSKYFQEMLYQNIYLAPSQFEVAFISTAHSTEDIEKTIKANYNALKLIKEKYL
jgi:glutamate-1-semialdehyde 2,1-aminomutase